MLGHTYESAWAGPSIIEVCVGNGDDTFGLPIQVGPEISSTLANSFEIPQMISKSDFGPGTSRNPARNRPRMRP